MADMLCPYNWEEDAERGTMGSNRGCFSDGGSLAVNHVQEATQGTKTAIAYAYCDYKNSKTHIELEPLSSITRQLAEQTISVPVAVKNFVTRKLKTTGMFLLAHLQIDQRGKQSNLKAVRKALNESPEKLSEFYREAIKRIEKQQEEDYQLARKALSYIFHARRPLNLEELRHFLGVEAEVESPMGLKVSRFGATVPGILSGHRP